MIGGAARRAAEEEPLPRVPAALPLARSAVFLALAAPAAALEVPLVVTAREAAPRQGAVVTSGVPFAKGAFADPSLVRLLRGAAELPLQARRTASWPDGSVRWLLADFPLDLPAAPASVSLLLRTGNAPAPVAGVTVDDRPDALTVRTGAATIVLAKSELVLRGSRFEVVSGGTTWRAVPESWVIEEPGPVKAVVRVEGRLASEAGARLGSELVGFRARLTFWRDDAAIRAAVTFRNRGPFCWDAAACTRAPDVVLEEARLGSTLLPAGGRYVFGPGVERTWDVVVAGDGAASSRETRYRADGSLAAGSVPPPPLAVAPAAYVVSTGAWGPMALPPAGLPADRQEDFDRFEKLHRALVVPSDVEDPPGLRGTTVWAHLAQDLASWNDYGDLRWDGNGCGTLSGNHYDWSYGMALHFLRTGRLEFADAARLFARHEEDLDVYHTAADGPAFSFQKNWEDRPSHDSPDNCFGGGRPTHTWSQGYALHWLLTGDPRGKDAFDEVQEGVRLYLYEAFSGEGRVSTSEIRTQGWLADNLVARWRIEPDAVLPTSSFGAKSIPRAIQDVLEDVFAREAAAGGAGFVVNGEEWEADYPHGRAPLQHLYFLEPALSAYEEVFRGRDAAYAARLLGLATRMVSWIGSVTYGGDTDASGLYRPRQVPFLFDARRPVEGQEQGQVLYGLMAANAAAFVAGEAGRPDLLEAARRDFRDAVRYALAIPGDARGEPSVRSPASYASSVFTGTESKVHGWLSRFGQRLLAAERGTTLFVPVVLDLPGLNGSRYTTELTLTNRGAGEARATFSYVAFAGGGSGSTTTPLALPPGRQVVVPDTLAFLAARGVPVPAEGARGGTLRVSFDGLASPGDAAVLARTTTPSGTGRAGLAYPAPRAQDLVAEKAVVYGLRESAADRTNLALLSGATAGTTACRPTLVSEGRTHVLPEDVSLAPGEWVQLGSVLGRAGFASGWAVVERVSGPGPFWAYAVFNDNGTNDGSYVAPSARVRPAGTVVVPAVVETPSFESELVLANPGSAAVTARLLWVETLATGKPRRFESVEPVAAGAQRILPSFVDRLRQRLVPVGGRGASYSGALFVTFETADGRPAQGYAGARTAAPAAGGGGFGLFTPGASLGECAHREAWLFGLRQDAAVRTNLALVNAGEDGTDVTLRYEVFDADTGRKVGTSRDLVLGPGAWLQVDRVLLGYALREGYVRVSRVSGVERFLAYAVVNDGASPGGPGTHDGSYVAMEAAE